MVVVGKKAVTGTHTPQRAYIITPQRRILTPSLPFHDNQIHHGRKQHRTTTVAAAAAHASRLQSFWGRRSIPADQLWNRFVASQNAPVHILTSLSLYIGAKWIKSLTQQRLGVFIGGHFNDVNLGAVLFTHRIDDDKHIQMKYWSAPGRTKPSFKEVMKLSDDRWKTAKKGLSLGPSCEYTRSMGRRSGSEF